MFQTVILRQNKKAFMRSLPDQASYETPRQREAHPGGNVQKSRSSWALPVRREALPDLRAVSQHWDIWTLLRKSRGRAGEAADYFALLCRALSYRVR